MNNIFCIYYELENTCNEWNSRVSQRYSSLQAAKADMKNYGDWYCGNGTGTIYKVTLISEGNDILRQEREQVYRVR